MFCIDPPWQFDDKLTMSDVNRGAESQYKSILTDQDIINLPIKDLVEDEAILALWTTGAKMDIALQCVTSWGFEYKQILVWVKTKKDPFEDIRKTLISSLKSLSFQEIKNFIKNFPLELNESMLSFNMGHYFRYTHEFVIIGTRGKVTKHVKNKSQRGVFFTPPLLPHSTKPEILQDKLELIFPDLDNRVEFFARRERNNWICAGNELPSTANEDILQTIERLKLC